MTVKDKNKERLISIIVCVLALLGVALLVYVKVNIIDNNIKDDKDSSYITDDMVVSGIQELCDDTFDSNYTFDIEDDTYVITVWFDNMSSDLVVTKVNSDSIGSWNKFTDNINECCKSTKKIADKADSKKHVDFILSDNKNHNVKLFESIDGEGVYDILNESEQ